jgi:hypothetical protein
MPVSVDVGISVSVDVGMIEDGMPESESEGETEGRYEEMGTTVTRELPLSPRLIDELRIGTVVSVDAAAAAAAVVVGSVAVVSATEETTEETALTIDERTGTMPRLGLLAAVVVASVPVEVAAAAGEVEEPPMIVERPTMIPPVEVDALGVVEEATAAGEELDVGRIIVDGKSPVEPTSPLSKFVAEATVVESVKVVSVVESGVVGELSAGCRIDSTAGSTPVEAAAGVVVGVTTEDGIPAVEPTAAVGVSVVGVSASVVESVVESGVESAAEGLEAGIIVLGKPPVEPTAAA